MFRCGVARSRDVVENFGMEISEATARAMQIHALYDDLNMRVRERVWTREEFMLGFMGDVGDLAKLVMAEEGVRSIPDSRAALEHELADCLWSVLVLARLYEVDLSAVFDRTMNDLAEHIREQLESPLTG